MDNKQVVRSEIATVELDITYPAYSGIMRITDPTLLARAGGLGIRLYDEIELDPHVYSVMQKRKMAVIARPWIVEPASSSRADKKAADLVRDQLNNMASSELLGEEAEVPVGGNFDMMCLAQLDAIMKGYSVGEVMWDVIDGDIVATEVRARNQFRFNFDDQFRLRLKTLNNFIPGDELPGRKFVVHTFGAKDSNPLGLGLGSRLYWPAYFKRNGIVFWSTYLDKFGSPTPVGKYAPGSDKITQNQVLAAVESIAQDMGVVMPNDATLEFLEAKRAGTVTYEQFVKYMDDQISECVLGETMTTSARGGAGLNAGGQAQVQNEVRMELVKADADLLSSTLNATLVPWISRYNMPNANPPRVWRTVEETKDLGAQATRDKAIFDMGYRPTLDYIQETYGGEWTDMKAVPPTGNNQAIPLPNTPDATDALAAFSDPENPTPPQAMSREMSSQAGDPWKAVVDHIGSLVQNAKSLSDLKRAIEDAYSGLPLDDLRAVQSMGYAAAQLAGLDEVESGN